MLFVAPKRHYLGNKLAIALAFFGEMVFYCAVVWFKAEAGDRGSCRVPEFFDWHSAGNGAMSCYCPEHAGLRCLFYKWIYKNKHQKDLLHEQ